MFIFISCIQKCILGSNLKQTHYTVASNLYVKPCVDKHGYLHIHISLYKCYIVIATKKTSIPL